MQVQKRTQCVTDALSEAAFSARASRCVCVHRRRASYVTELTSRVCLTNKTIKCLNLTLPRLAEKVRYP